ncbi:excisionase family DNA-binding protein [Polynucleobacter sp. Ross1-W9]|uniref:excisionase family DNA-binding protein n=1 Tax=Polynucleobacter parvulilacunae TaxID=1855631 RepID=UPI001C0E41E3|nr:helix-turn-helix domain-containing protein [Polynucleobacter parvulilacunae]MBU3556211.1 excisionase family DNA-binding protein [Polynucleobacter parvulilacunae]
MNKMGTIKKIGEREFYTTGECAKALGLSRGTIQKLVNIGVLRAYVTIGKHRRIETQSLKDMENHIRAQLHNNQPDLRPLESETQEGINAPSGVN